MGRATLRRALSYPPLLVVLGAGLVLRIGLMIGYRPAVLVHYDSIGYLDAANTGLFDDPIRPAGYPLFLRLLALGPNKIEVVTGAQALLGLATAVILFLIVQRLAAPRWLGLIPAAVVALDADQLFLEHALMSEALFAFLTAFAVYAAVRALDPEHRLAWALGAAALTAGAATTRTVGLFLVPVLAVWLLVAIRPPLRRALAPALGGAALGAAILVGYAAANDASGGIFGFSRSGGWAIYGRAAPFADCTKFDPPAGTERLCERRPADERPGPDFYAWVGGSPARAIYGGPPNSDSLVGEFGRRAILAQPGDYAAAAFKDLARFVVPGVGRTVPLSGDGPEGVSFHRRDPLAEQQTLDVAGRFYGHQSLHVDSIVETYAGYGSVMRLHGWLIGLLLLAAAAGAFFARGGQEATQRSERAAIVLLALYALVIMGVPAATGEYTARYAVPAAGLLSAAGALGAWRLWSALRRPRDQRRARIAR